MERKTHKTTSSTKSNGPPLLSPSGSTAIAPTLTALQVSSGRYASSSKIRSTNSMHTAPRMGAGKGNKANMQITYMNTKRPVVNVSSVNTEAIGVSDQLTTVSPKMLALRNKNEEAINDLRQRIPEIENIFDVHSRVGNGTFSTVLLGTLKKEREMPEHMRRKFAIKHHVPTSHPERIMKELQCMAKIGGSNNVVGINCCIRYNESVAFIMPYMPHDRFHDFFNKMDISEVQCYMKNLLVALRHVHKFNVIHRDVKPSNFLYNRRKRQYLLVDFGLAQQVPQSHTIAANNLYLPLPAAGGAEGKRTLDEDEEKVDTPADTSLAAAELTASSKRLRCSGPQGDQHNVAAFKMPLKQLNEITTPNKPNNCSNGGANVCETAHSRTVRSGMINTVINNRLQQKLRTTPAGQITNSNTPTSIVNNTAGAFNTAEVANARYNTNRNLSVANNSKCFCYGKPQACNICLIKKEIHASRAGTPGYRPPEVLLKYADQTTAVDVWAVGVIFLSVLSSVYPFFKAPNDFVALAEMVTIFGDKIIRQTAFLLDRLVTLNQKTKPLDLRKLCVRFRNRIKFSSPELLKKHQRPDGTCEVCKNCDQFFFNCLCSQTAYNTEPLDADDIFPPSAYDLLYKLLEVNPHKRITAEEALKHPFFKENFGQSNISK